MKIQARSWPALYASLLLSDLLPSARTYCDAFESREGEIRHAIEIPDRPLNSNPDDKPWSGVSLSNFFHTALEPDRICRLRLPRL